jgi:1,4-dihydroxy-2-naphthoate octaprenyltransferase
MKRWISAMRLRTLPLAASCIMAGTVAAAHDGGHKPWVIALALLTTFLLQILSNLANDYGDFSHGVDNENRVGPTRALQSGAISPGAMKSALIMVSALTLLSGITMLWLAFGAQGLFMQALIWLSVGIAAIAAAIKYTVGSSPYGYRGLGDLFVFLFFGMVGVMGTYMLNTAEWSWMAMPLAIAIGCYSTAVLNLNNLRDHENDRAMNKRTLVVMMGFINGKIYQTALIVIGTSALAYWIALHGHHNRSWLAIIPAVIQCILLVKVWKTQVPQALDSELKKVALLTFVTSVLLWFTL